jgi:hypothetical protein
MALYVIQDNTMQWVGDKKRRWEVHKHSKPWISNPRRACLYYAARGRSCVLCTYYKNCTIIYSGIPFIVISPRATREPAHNNGRDPLP